MHHDLALNAVAWEQRGIAARDAGRHTDAITFFSQAVALADSAMSWLGLALSQIDLKRDEDAVASLRRAQSLAPQSGVVQHLLATLTGDSPARAPEGYVKWLFNTYAAKFDNHITRLGYRGPEMLHDLVCRRWKPEGQFDILDLGCGTGLSGVPFRPYAARLDGIDLAPKMLEQAQRRGIYDGLFLGEVHAMLRQLPADGYDLLLAADTLIYIGDVAELFGLVARALRPGGSFLFTVEMGAEGSGYRLTQTGRYSHADDYLGACAGDLLTLTERIDGMIRIEDGRFTDGRAYHLAKPARC